MNYTSEIIQHAPGTNQEDRRTVTETVESVTGLFEQLVDFAPDFIYTVNEYGAFSYVNSHAEELTGYSREELLNMSYLDIIAPNYVESIKLFYIRQTMRGPNVTYLEFPIVTKSGAWVWIGQKVVLHLYSSSIGFQAIAREISGKKNFEHEIHQPKEDYKNLFENAAQGIFQSSKDGKIIYANPAFLRMLGFDSLEDLQQIDLADLYVDQNRDQITSLLDKQGQCTNIEIKIRRKDGKIITVLEHSNAVCDINGQIIRYEGILEDITEKKAAEDHLRHYVEALKTSEQALRSIQSQKNKMYSIISHDLRSPFASILGFCNLILKEHETLPAKEIIEYIGYVKQAAETQLQFVNSLLDFSKIDSGATQFDMIEQNVQDLVTDAIISLLGVARQKNIVLTSNVPDTLTVQGDERWLTQVFSNLIGNALKFTKTEGKVTISAHETPENIMIDVTDSGVGMSMDNISKLFHVDEKFTTLGTNGERGTGLGLITCKEIIERHGGSILVESEVGKGSTFHILFPRTTPTLSKKIMIVDDDPGVRKLHTHYIEKNFPLLTIIQATNGKEAQTYVTQSHPDLILTDYSMPELDGLSFMKSLKNDAGTTDIPLIVITGNDSDANRESLILAGARAVLIKPVIEEELYDVVNKILHEEHELALR